MQHLAVHVLAAHVLAANVLAANVLAAHPLAAQVLAGEPTINTTGVVAWIVKYIIPLLFAFAAVVIMSRAHQGRTRENAVVAVNLFLGIILIAAGGTLFAFGQQLVDLILG